MIVKVTNSFWLDFDLIESLHIHEISKGDNGNFVFVNFKNETDKQYDGIKYVHGFKEALGMAID